MFNEENGGEMEIHGNTVVHDNDLEVGGTLF